MNKLITYLVMSFIFSFGFNLTLFSQSCPPHSEVVEGHTIRIITGQFKHGWERSNISCKSGWRLPTVEELKTILKAKNIQDSEEPCFWTDRCEDAGNECYTVNIDGVSKVFNKLAEKRIILIQE